MLALLRRAAALLLATLPVLAPSAPARAGEQIVIGAGRLGGYYDAVAGRLRTLLVQRYGYDAEVRSSLGSIENLARLDDPRHPVSVALAQADALNGFLEQSPESAAQLTVLADVGAECVFLIARRNGPIASAADLKRSSGNRLSVDRPGSGASVTFDYMRRLEPDFQNTAVDHRDGLEVLAEIRDEPATSGASALMLVHRPRVVSPALQVVLEHPGTYQLVPLRREDLRAASLPDGKPVYTFETVTIRDVSVETMCTRALVVASRQKLPDEVRANLARVLADSHEYVAPGSE